jgi:hypothetical protein
MIRYCYIVTEGPQDIEFLARLLKFKNLRKITKFSDLDQFWHPIIPTKFPVDDDLVKRVPVPTFLQNTELSIALHSANGIDRIVRTIEESLAVISVLQIFGISIFLDADNQEPPQQRFEKIRSKLFSLNLPCPRVPGEVTQNSPRLGIFIAPNNQDLGTLEDILLECARVNYPDLLDRSTNYLSSIDRSQLTSKDLEEFRKPAGKNKALISTIASILKPGKSLQVSLQDNQWINERTLSVESVQRVKIFLDEMTGSSGTIELNR